MIVVDMKGFKFRRRWIGEIFQRFLLTGFNFFFGWQKKII